MSPARPMGRRLVLRLGAGSAALLAVGGGLGAWTTRGYEALLAPDDVPIALSVKELAVVRAACEALLPAEGAFPSALDLRIHQRVDEEVWAASDVVRSGFKDGLQLVEHLPPLYGHPHRFTALPPPTRAEVFAAMTRSRVGVVRQIASAIKQVTHLFYYADERVWPAVHYDGVFVETRKPPASSTAYASLLAARRRA